MLERREPFDSLQESRGSDLVGETGLRVTHPDPGLILLQSPSESTLRAALTSQTGLPLPPAQEACIRGAYALLWLTPAQWLLELPANEIGSLQNALTKALATSLAAVTDMSDAFACCEISGTRAAEALMSGCNLDLRTHAFPAGRVVRTALADIPAIIWNPGNPDRFRCLCDRSFAGHLRDWLADLTLDQRSASG